MLQAARSSAAVLPQLLQQACSPVAWFASKAKAADSAKASEVLTPVKDWKAVKLPAATADTVPVTTTPGQAFVGDLRSTSGLGKGDGINNHTGKWLQGDSKSPMEYIQSTEPIKVNGPVVASYGSDDPALGCPVEYINLRGSSYDNPAVCKYTGNKYYSEPHTWLAH